MTPRTDQPTLPLSKKASSPATPRGAAAKPDAAGPVLGAATDLIDRTRAERRDLAHKAVRS